MIKTVYILLLKFLFVFVIYSQNFNVTDSIPSFRGIKWGEKLESVKSLELADYEQLCIGFGVKVLTFSGTFLDHNAKIDYVFENDLLTETFYTIRVEDFTNSFNKVKEFYFNELGEPNYWASSHPNSSIDWAYESKEIFCRGPEIYWEFCNGFIGIISERYKNELTISILYAYNKTIEEYGKFVIYPYDSLVKN